jgi:hypothetical protein
MPRFPAKLLVWRGTVCAALFAALVYQVSPSMLLASLRFGLAVIITTVAHEGAHYLLARQLQADPWWAPDRLSVYSRPSTLWHQRLISVAGPLAGVAASWLLMWRSDPLVVLALWCLAISHLAMLLPIYHDGRLMLMRLKAFK